LLSCVTFFFGNYYACDEQVCQLLFIISISAGGVVSLRGKPLTHPEEGLIIVFYGKSQLARPGTAGALLAQTGDLPTKTVISPSSCVSASFW